LKVEYEDLLTATGDYAKDTLTIGGVVVKGMQFGIMYHATVVSGLLGVGFPGIEFLASSGYGEYNNLPILLANQGYIQSAAYSLWLNGEHGTSGSILFGGVDTDKFYGSLVALPLVQGRDPSIEEFYVTLQGVQMRDAAGNLITLNGGSSPDPVVLDSGTTFTLLPAAIAESIFTVVNAVISNGAAYVDCSLASSLFTVEYTFTGITISVPISQLILPQNFSLPISQSVLPQSPSPTQCPFGIQSSTIGVSILGDTFLSSAYVVYDLDNKKAHLAQAVINATSENIVEIGSGPNAVPSVTGVHTSPKSTASCTPTTSNTHTTTTSMTTPTPKPAPCNHVRFPLTYSVGMK